LSEDTAPQRRLHSRRRSRRLRSGRQRLVEELLPRLDLAVEGLAAGSLDPFGLFEPPVRAVWLEIGFGAGEHLAWQAERHPDVGFIGCEPYLAGVARLMGHIAERELRNVRIVRDDARLALHALAPASLERAFLLFPDPWPKARHADRRFLAAATVAAMARVLRDGALWRIASDHPVYQRWALERMGASADFRWLARGPEDWRNRPDDWPQTRYEAKALAEGRRPAFLAYARLPRPAGETP